MSAQQFKKCSKCGEEKALEGFYKHKQGKYGVVAACKACMRLHKRNKRRANPEREREKAREYAAKNREVFRRSHKKWRDKNIDQERDRVAKYRAENLEFLREKNRDFRNRHKDYYSALYAETKAEKQAVTTALSKKIGAPWSIEEDEFIKSKMGEIDTYQMAICLGRTWESTRTRHSKLGKELKNAA